MATRVREGKKEEEGNACAGGTWRTFIELIQKVWEMGCIPHQMLWMVVVLLPKGGVD